MLAIPDQRDHFAGPFLMDGGIVKCEVQVYVLHSVPNRAIVGLPRYATPLRKEDDFVEAVARVLLGG